MNLNQITHTARRDHRCAFCGLTVPAGQQYVRAPVPGGGLAAKKPMHIGCYEARLTSASKTNSVTKEKDNGTSAV